MGRLVSALSAGSAELAVAATNEGKALILPDYRGTRLDAITALKYSTYRQTVDPGNNLAIALQFNVDFDLIDGAAGYQGRLLFEPYQGIGGNVPDSTWQEWDALAGFWWGTRATVSKGGVNTPNPCVQATPCTWAQLLALFPDLGVHGSYGAVILKAGSGWVSFRGNVDELVISVGGVRTTFDFELDGPAQAVPVVAPDNMPSALFDSLGVVSAANGHGVPWTRAIVAVTFKWNATAAERQAAVQAIGGTVVGGHRWAAGDGDYFVRISDTTMAGIQAANAILRALPQVHHSFAHMVEPLDHSAYIKPNEGAGWNGWRLKYNETNATRPNWPLEAISAPLAWGCNGGDTLSTLAVVDVGITNTTTIAANARPEQVLTGGAHTFYRDHGTEVAELLASVGTDGERSTGIMRTARMALWDFRVDPSGDSTLGGDYENASLIAGTVIKAALAGAKVINVSQSVPWPDSIPNPIDTDTADVDRREKAHMALVYALAVLKQVYSLEPLIVLAAGNDTLDARWAGYTLARNEFLNQVLVVGGTNASGGVWGGSNTGALVDIYAPSDGVYVFGRQSTPYTAQGTSYAAPLAAGVAGLVKGFDPSLDNDELRASVIAGARDAGGYRVLDAYGSLRAAARRTGAPLCGNRVWSDGGQIVERDSAGGGVQEAIVSGLSEIVHRIAPIHGGRVVYYMSYPSGNFVMGKLTYQPSTQSWSHNPMNGDDRESDTDYSTENLAFGGSHDGIQTAFVFPYLADDDLIYVDLYGSDTLGNGPDELRYMWSNVTGFLDPVAWTQPAFGQRVVVALRQNGGTTITEHTHANWNPVTLHTMTGRHVYNISMNERESEFVIQSASLTQSLADTASQIYSGSDCRVEYYSTVFALLKSIPAPGACLYQPYGASFGARGQTAPFRIPDNKARGPRRVPGRRP